jgi:O-antigen ligase
MLISAEWQNVKMSSQDLMPPLSNLVDDEQKTIDSGNSELYMPDNPPPRQSKVFRGLSSFWYDRLIELGLILSMALYYIIGNGHLGTGRLFQLNPLLSLPFLVIFIVLCYYRLPFALALLPLSLPFYLQQKTVFSHFSFSIAEIALGICTAVALLQILVQRGKWRYSLSWQELRDRLGPFAIPILVFLAAAGISILIAYEQHFALRAFREEVFDPLLFLILALFCLRTRKSVTRLLAAMLGTGLLVALLGLAQYFFFRNQLVLEDGVRRVHAMYGSANSIGLLFDYVFPIGIALVLARTRKLAGLRKSWMLRIFAIAICIPLLFVLYLSQSRGAWVAIAVATLFILMMAAPNRKVLLIGSLAFIVVMAAVIYPFRHPIYTFIFADHVSIYGISTFTKRLYLWQSALRMIQARPWFGFGMDNWLCYYSANKVCHIPASIQPIHYWILRDPVTHARTGLSDEPTLSHPHNIFLHVWVSMGVFGLLAFIAVLVLCGWLFARIIIHLRAKEFTSHPYLQWMTIGVGAAMLAALVQGQVDSSFLEQDLAFCFWMLVTALLLLRVLSRTPWRGQLRSKSAPVTGSYSKETDLEQS